MQLRLAVAQFFRRFPRVKLSEKEGMMDGDMEPVMYFLVSPRGHRCLVEV